MKQSNTNKCKKCGEEKPRELFSQSRGWEGVCKKCRSEERHENGEYIIERLRKHEKRGSDVQLSVSQVRQMLEKERCTYCGNDFAASNLTIDHIFPLASKFNETNIANVVQACRSCNSRKGDKHVLTFYRECDTFTDELYREFVEHYTSVLFCGFYTQADIEEVTQFLFETAKQYESTREKLSISS